MSGPFVFAVVQVDDDEPVLDAGRLGTYEPVNFDGFYRDQQEAREVARYFADERPDLRTYLIMVLDEVKK